MTSVGRWLCGLLCLAALGEFGVRYMGWVDVPLFVQDAQIGYLPAPSQAGSFMRRNEWAFNELGMGTKLRFQPGPERDLLLMGDSIVYGGPHYAEGERLGPLLEKHLPGAKVWPVAAGSWAVRNQLAWLRRHPGVVRQVDDIVFVVTSEDLTPVAASWHCESNHPTHRPWFALGYLAIKGLHLDACDQTRPEHRVPDGIAQQELRAWLDSAEAKDKRVTFVLYPFKGPLASAGQAANEPERQVLASVGIQPACELARHSLWHPNLYKDDAHPTPQGNRILAQWVAQAMLGHCNSAAPRAFS